MEPLTEEPRVGAQRLSSASSSIASTTATTIAGRPLPAAATRAFAHVVLPIAAMLGLAACGQATRLVSVPAPRREPLALTAMRLPRDSSTGAIDRLLHVAERRYRLEQRGPLVRKLLRRVAADRGLKAAARSGDPAALRAAVARRFDSVWYHWHVSRLLIVRGSRTIVDVGVPFVIAPSSRVLRDARGRAVTTLEISDQDVIGFVRFMHRNHAVDVVARGVGAGHVRASLPAALHVRLPDRGLATIAGRRYRVASFTRRALGDERVKIWILLRT